MLGYTSSAGKSLEEPCCWAARIADPVGVEGETVGLGLLDLGTVMRPDKVVRRAVAVFSDLPDAWSALRDVAATGYEIRNGRIHRRGRRAS